MVPAHIHWEGRFPARQRRRTPRRAAYFLGVSLYPAARMATSALGPNRLPVGNLRVSFLSKKCRTVELSSSISRRSVVRSRRLIRRLKAEIVLHLSERSPVDSGYSRSCCERHKLHLLIPGDFVASDVRSTIESNRSPPEIFPIWQTSVCDISVLSRPFLASNTPLESRGIVLSLHKVSHGLRSVMTVLLTSHVEVCSSIATIVKLQPTATYKGHCSYTRAHVGT